MNYSYYFGLWGNLDLSFSQFLFVIFLILFATFGFISYIAFKLDTNFKRTIYLLGFNFFWLIVGGLISGLAMLFLCAVLYVLVREFAGDYS